MRLQFLGVQSTPSLLLLPDPLRTGLMVPVRVLSMSKIDLFEDYAYLIAYNCKLFVLRIIKAIIVY